MSEEHAKDNKIEELAESLANVVDEEPAKESAEIEIKLEEEAATEESVTEEVAEEETTEEAVPAEEAPAEEAPTEEASAEEAPTEEASAEETPVEEAKKSRKPLIITAIAVVAVLGLLAGIYFGMAKKYETCFVPGTVVNGTDCSGKTVADVEAMLQKQVEEYTLVITGANEYREEILATEIDIVYNGEGLLDDEFKNQNEYMWPKGLFEKHEITAEAKFQYDSAKLNERIASLNCLKPENQVAAVAATVVYQEGQFIIQDETYGTQVDATKLTETIIAAISGFQTTLDLTETGCYIQPRFTKDSAEVVAARDEMNKYLTANITYSLDGVTVNLDKSQTYQWISVDENMSPVISNDGVKLFAKTLSSKYNTADRGGQLTTPRGKVVNMPLGGYGRVVGIDAETKQLINEIKEGKTITREPIFSRQATPEGQNIWGNTYLEVDITEQHMWFVVNGQVALETDVITGKKGSNDTPTGVFNILEKIAGKNLRGRPGPDGKPSYIVWVDYWMRVTWSGIGFHDCTWHSVFGGDRYVNNGSHGCINMPPEKAKELYAALPIGTPVVIHY